MCSFRAVLTAFTVMISVSQMCVAQVPDTADTIQQAPSTISIPAVLAQDNGNGNGITETPTATPPIARPTGPIQTAEPERPPSGGPMKDAANLRSPSGLHGNNTGMAPAEAGEIQPNPFRPTIGLALGGGGARGAAHIGVLRVFERAGLPIDYIAGSSMGAVVGGMYAAGVPLDRIQYSFISGEMFKAFIPTSPWVKVLTMPVTYAISRITKSPAGFYKGNRIAEYVDSLLPPGRKNIETTAIKYAAVTSNLVDGKTYPIIEGELGRAVQASSALPLLFRPVATYEGKLLVDGGLRANLPTLAARQSKADIVIAVNVSDNLPEKKIGSFRTYKSILNRGMGMIMSEVDEHQLENADIVVRPFIDGKIGIASTKRQDSLTAIREGETAALKALPQIAKLIREKMEQRAQEATPVHYRTNQHPSYDTDVPTGARPASRGLVPRPTVTPAGHRVLPTPENPDPPVR